MKQAPIPTCLLLNIGGVLPTNGWDHPFRSPRAPLATLGLQNHEGTGNESG